MKLHVNETKQNETKRNQTKQNETKSNENNTQRKRFKHTFKTILSKTQTRNKTRASSTLQNKM